MSMMSASGISTWLFKDHFPAGFRGLARRFVDDGEADLAVLAFDEIVPEGQVHHFPGLLVLVLPIEERQERGDPAL